VTPLVSGGRSVALLAHRPGLLDDPGLVEQIAAAARLALDNERLQAQVRAQLEDLRASRARIVERGDAERRRLERDLHDGAQQRLVSLALSLRLARLGGDADPDVAALEQAEAEVRQALEELRGLARGLTRRPSPRRAWGRRWRHWPNRPPARWCWDDCHRSASSRTLRPPPTSSWLRP